MLKVAMPLLASLEGGYVNHPADPGGATKYGITLRTWCQHRKDGDHRHVSDITLADAEEIYEKVYWPPFKDLPDPINALAFVFGVNAGPERAIRILQRVVSEKVDGVAGPSTCAAVDRVGLLATFTKYSTAILNYYEDIPIDKRKFFIEGWRSRHMQAVVFFARYLPK